MDSSGRLWSPSSAAVREAPLTAFTGCVRARRPRRSPPMPTCTAGRSRIAAPSGAWSGSSAASSASAAIAALVDGDRMPGAAFFPDARLNFAENLLRKSRRVGRDRLPRRGQGRAPPLLGRAAGAGVATAAGDARARRQAGRPRRRDAAEHARGHRRHARGRLARRDLVVLLAGFRRRGRARPLRPDRAGAVHRLRRLLVQRQAERRDRQGAGRAGAAAERPAGDHRRLSRHRRAGGDRDAARGHARRGDRALCAAGPDVRAAAVLAPALHPVLVGHDRRPEMHRPLRRRHAAPAPQGTPAACRHPRRRPRLLLHHLRLDDVELAGLGAGLRRDAAAL